jgi:hypothetical protein
LPPPLLHAIAGAHYIISASMLVTALVLEEWGYSSIFIKMPNQQAMMALDVLFLR